MKLKQDKTIELYGLCKVPDEIIIKELKVEIGKANSYIQELEDENNLLKVKINEIPNPTDILTKEEIMEIKQSQICEMYKKEKQHITELYTKLKKEHEDLIIRYAKLRNQ